MTERETTTVAGWLLPVPSEFFGKAREAGREGVSRG